MVIVNIVVHCALCIYIKHYIKHLMWYVNCCCIKINLPPCCCFLITPENIIIILFQAVCLHVTNSV